MMPITFTEDAANLILSLMDKQKLDKNEFAINFAIKEGQLGFDFTREIENHKTIHDLKFFCDPQIQENIIITTYKSSDGRQGIIFLGENEIKK